MPEAPVVDCVDLVPQCVEGALRPVPFSCSDAFWSIVHVVSVIGTAATPRVLAAHLLRAGEGISAGL